MSKIESPAEQAKRLVSQAREHSRRVVFQRDPESARSLVLDFIAQGQDDGPDIGVTSELLGQLRPRDALALDFARNHFGELGTEVLAFPSSVNFDWANANIRNSVMAASKVILGLLEPGHICSRPEVVLDNMILARASLNALMSLE